MAVCDNILSNPENILTLDGKHRGGTGDIMVHPYSCLVSSCPERKITFESPSTWIEHEFRNHRDVSEWICIESCGKKFQRKDDFMAHILEVHLEGSATTTTMRMLHEISVNREHRIPRARLHKVQCPFCQTEILETRESFQDHVGGHLEKLAKEFETLPLMAAGDLHSTSANRSQPRSPTLITVDDEPFMHGNNNCQDYLLLGENSYQGLSQSIASLKATKADQIAPKIYDAKKRIADRSTIYGAKKGMVDRSTQTINDDEMAATVDGLPKIIQDLKLELLDHKITKQMVPNLFFKSLVTLVTLLVGGGLT